MIYGIEQTTDSRNPETKVLKFTSRKRAIAWAQDIQGFAWSGGARNDIPVPQQNWHRRLRDLYEVAERNPGTSYFARQCREWYKDCWISNRRMRQVDFEARWIVRNGTTIEVPALEVET